MKKRLIAGLLASVMAVSLSGCGASKTEEVTLNVFAAASMTETLTEIQEMYKDVAPNVTLVFNFDSSGTLKTQIHGGSRLRSFYFRSTETDESA